MANNTQVLSGIRQHNNEEMAQTNTTREIKELLLPRIRRSKSKINSM